MATVGSEQSWDMDLPRRTVMLWCKTCQAWKSRASPSSFPGRLGTWRRGKSQHQFTHWFSVSEQGDSSSGAHPGFTSPLLCCLWEQEEIPPPKLQLFQEKRRNSGFPLHLRELLRSSKSEAWGLVPGFGRSLLFKATLDISRSLQTFFSRSGAPDLSFGEELGNENSTEKINCGWQRGVLGDVSHWGFRLAREEGNLVGGDAYKFLAGREEGNLVGVDPLRFLLDRKENNLQEETHGRVVFSFRLHSKFLF